MKILGPLIRAKFVERPNRFITMVNIDGVIHRSHLPDPGRLKELLFSGANLLVRPAPKHSVRKTKYSTVMVNHDGQLISLVTVLPNQFVKEALEKKELSIFKDYTLVRPEVTVEKHRFDFLLKSSNGSDFYLEVKSVTFVENGVAQFPDAVTERGRKHALALKKLVEEGKGAGILFVCQRPDASSFRPMWERDPKLANAVLDANKSGVKVWCITLNVSKTDMTFHKEIPVNLELPGKVF
jgi:sugar fermentation stimulation protein A